MALQIHIEASLSLQNNDTSEITKLDRSVNYAQKNI